MNRSRAALVACGAALVLIIVALAASTPLAPFAEVQPGPSRSGPHSELPPQRSDDSGLDIPPVPSGSSDSSGYNPIFGKIIAALLIAAAVAFVVLVAARTVREFRQRTRAAREAALAAEAELVEVEIDAEAVRETMDESLTRLRLGVDTAGAIVECWRRLEEVAAASGTPRKPSQTAEEFTLQLLGTTPAPEADLERLADLYRAAMFARVPPGDEGRLQAVDVLERLVAALGPEGRGAQ